MDTDVHQRVKEEALEDHSAGVDQQDPEQFHMKEEQEEVWTRPEEEQLHLKEEAKLTRFPFTSVSIKSEDDEDKPLFSQLLHQQQVEDRDVLTSSSAGPRTAETGRGAESSRNPVLNLNEQISDFSETDVSEDDVNLNVELLHSGPESGEGDSCRKVQTEPKSFSCDICEIKFSCNENLNSHMRAHTGEKPFACELCGRSFTQRSKLNRHMRVHTGHKPFACELCGKSFDERTHLNTHMRVHTGEKPFLCELCKQRFKHKSTLNSHMRVHTGEKPFACELCGKCFTRRTFLNSHMRVHTGQKPFACGLCEQRFRHKSTLNNHMRVYKGHNTCI